MEEKYSQVEEGRDCRATREPGSSRQTGYEHYSTGEDSRPTKDQEAYEDESTNRLPRHGFKEALLP
jgi:hypothetical protein